MAVSKNCIAMCSSSRLLGGHATCLWPMRDPRDENCLDNSPVLDGLFGPAALIAVTLLRALLLFRLAFVVSVGAFNRHARCVLTGVVRE